MIRRINTIEIIGIMTITDMKEDIARPAPTEMIVVTTCISDVIAVLVKLFVQSFIINNRWRAYKKTTGVNMKYQKLTNK